MASDTFGVLIMAHGGTPEWNAGVMSAVQPLLDQYPIEVTFGMADPSSMQAAVRRLEARGIRKIGVVRLFISGDSFYDRTEKILGLRPGAPSSPVGTGHGTGGGQAHSMALWRIQTEASFALSTHGLAEADGIGAVLAERARTLSRNPEKEDVLILAHGAGDDAENERWIAFIDTRAKEIRDALPFRRVQVVTLREDWPAKRVEAEQKSRAFITSARDEGVATIVIPFRVQGFGPYAKVLDGLDYISDGVGLIPHPNVTQWIAGEIKALRGGAFRTPDCAAAGCEGHR